MITKLSSENSDFPRQLNNISEPVKKLFIRGSLNTDNNLVAIVGSRKASNYGKQACELIARELVLNSVGIVSGLALGIDGWAHKVALENNGYTIAVLGGGVDKIYPSSHRDLASKIISSHGAIISEYSNGTPHMGHQFLERNRIISGLSQAVVVIEAAKRSGTLNTARHALEQGKEVFAVPGPITSPMSEGTNQLIKAGAHPVTSASDILEILEINPTNQDEVRMPVFEDNAQSLVFQLIKNGYSQDGYEIQQKSGLSTQLFQQALTMLEIEGHIRPLGNNQWSTKS